MQTCKSLELLGLAWPAHAETSRNFYAPKSPASMGLAGPEPEEMYYNCATYYIAGGSHCVLLPSALHQQSRSFEPFEFCTGHRLRTSSAPCDVCARKVRHSASSAKSRLAAVRAANVHGMVVADDMLPAWQTSWSKKSPCLTWAAGWCVMNIQAACQQATSKSQTPHHEQFQAR